MLFLIFLVILNLSLQIKGAMDYCNIKSQAGCRDSKEHILCKFPDETPKCAEMVVTTTDDFRKKITKMHNDFRNTWAAGEWPGQKEKGFKPAANMRKMTWDDELEMVARRHLVACLEDHEDCRFLERFDYGQNFGLDFTKRRVSEPESVFYPWVDEFKTYDPGQVDLLTEVGAHGHFTALVWADSYLMGCVEGRYIADPNGPYKGENIRKVVCNYAPSGNLIGIKAKIYLTGQPCSKCPDGFPCGSGEYKNLCASGNKNALHIYNFFVLLFFAIKNLN